MERFRSERRLANAVVFPQRGFLMLKTRSGLTKMGIKLKEDVKKRALEHEDSEKSSKKTRTSEKSLYAGQKPLKKPKQGQAKEITNIKKSKNSTKKTTVSKPKTDSDTDKTTLALHEMKKKTRKVARKSLKNNYELSKKAKQLWEMVRREDCPKESRLQLCEKLHNLIKDRIKELIFAHDTARVIECLVVHGSDAIREDLYGRMKDDLLQLMKSKYSKFIVEKFLKHGSKQQREAIIKAMYGHVRRLIHHSEGAHVVECAYNDYANAQQRSALVEEFYGPTYALFKDAELKTLENILTKEVHHKDGILNHIKDILSTLVDKSALNYSVIHHVLLEYLLHCSHQDRAEMIELVRDKIIHMLHTRNGARVGMQCIWHGTTKDRRTIIKSMKTHVHKICLEEHGHMVLLALFDCVDDTVLIQKAIIDEMGRSISELPFHPHGRKVLLFLLAPRCQAYFHPDVIKILSLGDGNSTSKKDPEIRRKELLTAVSRHLIKLTLEQIESMIFCASANVVLQMILTKCVGDISLFLEKIVELTVMPLESGNEKAQHIVEHPAGHRLLKCLIRGDKEKAQIPDTVLFSDLLLLSLSESTIKSWIDCNRATFLLLGMLETDIPRIACTIRQLVSPLLNELATKKFKGAELLYNKLKQSTV